MRRIACEHLGILFSPSLPNLKQFYAPRAERAGDLSSSIDRTIRYDDDLVFVFGIDQCEAIQDLSPNRRGFVVCSDDQRKFWARLRLADAVDYARGT